MSRDLFWQPQRGPADAIGMMPTAPAPVLPSQDAAWWDGPLLVVPINGRVVQRCVRCGEPAAQQVRQKVIDVVAGFLRKALLELGLCDAHARRRHRWLSTGWGMFVGGLVAMPLGIQLVIVVPIAAILAILLGPIVALVGALVVINARRVLSPCRITDTHVWLADASPFAIGPDRYGQRIEPRIR